MKHVVVGTLIAVTGVAQADELITAREQPLVEVSHTVDIRITDGVATYKVQRQFRNPGTLAEEARLAIDLPYGATATGLRIRARDRWYDADLMERDKAAALYQEMTGVGPWQPKDPALLSWNWADKLHLQVFPVLPGQVSTVEYTLTVPTRYMGGRYWLSYPRVVAGANQHSTSRPLATPAITVHPDWGDSHTAIVIDGKRVMPDTAFVLTPPVRQSWELDVNAEPNASYVASAIEIAASSHTQKTFKTATVTLDIKHTYKSDLKVELVTPQGTSIVLHDRMGGDKNNISGSFPVQLPAGTTGAGTWRLVASDHVALDTGTIDGWSIAFGDTKQAATDTPVFIPDAPESDNDAGVAPISIAPPDLHMWTARFGKVVASAQHAFARLEVDVAPKLSELPKRPQVVFLVDASFSVGSEHLAAQLATIKAYLSHVPDAEVEIIAVRRRAQRVFGSFVSVKTALAGLANAKTFVLGNGSAIDDGARLAALALADRTGPRRVVIASDELFRSALDPAQTLGALANLSKDTVVHLVRPYPDGDDRVSLAPAPETALSELATKHHGIHVELHGVPAKTEKDLAPVVLELVRPTKIDHLAITGVTATADTLHEGEGLRIFEGSKTAPDKVVLTGRIWSDPVRKELTPTPAFSQKTAAFVFGADEYHDLSNEEMMTVAMVGRAVSPVTSYVAAEPGTRPSIVGLYSTIGHGSGTGSGYGVGGGLGMLGGRVAPDLPALIDTTACEKQVKPAAHWSVTLDVETTKDEIVDVIGNANAVKDPMTACLIETIWNVRLTSSFDHERETFHVVLGAK